MISFEYIVVDKQGLHAMNAVRLSRASQEYDCRIVLKSRKGSADCKNALSLMGLGVRQGECLEFIVEGADENKVFRFLKDFLKVNL